MAGDEAGLSPADRLWRRVNKTSDCWLWTGHLSGGYGRIRVNGTRVQVHRLAYEMLVGPIADGLQLDHLCRDHRCVNPEHLEPVTPRVNYLRGVSPMAEQARQIRCKRGHPLTGANVKRRGNKRECRACALDAQRARRARNRDQINARKRELYALAKAG